MLQDDMNYTNDNTTTTYIMNNYGKDVQRIIYCNPYIRNKDVFNVSSIRQKGYNGDNERKMKYEKLLLKQKEQICKGKNKGMNDDMQGKMNGIYLCFGRNYKSGSYKIENGPQFQELPIINTNVYTIQNDYSLHNTESEHKDTNEKKDNNTEDNVIQIKPKLKKQIYKKKKNESNNVNNEKKNKIYTTYKPKLMNVKSNANSIRIKNNSSNNIVLPYLYSKTPSYCSSSVNSPAKNYSYNDKEIEILFSNNNQFQSQVSKIKQMLSKPYYK
jgi:hypothetical protein